MRQIKICANCGKQFINSMKIKFCSRECLREHQRNYNLIYGQVYRRLKNG